MDRKKLCLILAAVFALNIAMICLVEGAQAAAGVRTFSWTIKPSMSSPNHAAISPRLSRY